MSNVELRIANSERTETSLPCGFNRQSAIDNRQLRLRGFSLVELLTVIFIIALLIGILIPSLSSARNSAKRLTTLKSIDSIKIGLEMFKNENGKDFVQTNGYPPSYAHPPIAGALTPDEAGQGKFPFLEPKPVVTGAHWLPAMLMGVDKNGYIKKSSVPTKDNFRAEPYKWYKPDPFGDGKTVLERSPLYVDPGMKTLATGKLPGRANTPLFTSWDEIQDLPVIVDAFDQPILYYAANAHGRNTNMVAKERDPRNEYNGGLQESGPPFYFHQDNQAFTGIQIGQGNEGWDFGGGKAHPIAVPGDALTPSEIIKGTPESPNPFARYILDRKIFSDIAAILGKGGTVPDTTPLRPVNAESFLLISAGVDGRFGTSDDVTNFPPIPEQ